MGKTFLVEEFKMKGLIASQLLLLSVFSATIALASPVSEENADLNGIIEPEMNENEWNECAKKWHGYACPTIVDMEIEDCVRRYCHCQEDAPGVYYGHWEIRYCPEGLVYADYGFGQDKKGCLKPSEVKSCQKD